MSLPASAHFFKQQQLIDQKANLARVSGQSRIHSLLQLADGYLNCQIDSALAYAKRAQVESDEIGYDWGYQKGKYQEAMALAHTTASSKVGQLHLVCEKWFEENGFEKDRWLSKIGYLKSITYSKPLKEVAREVDAILGRVDPQKEPYICGMAWYYLFECQKVHQYNKPDFRESMDTAEVLFGLANDSTMITMLALKQQEHGRFISKRGPLLRLLRQAKNWGNRFLTTEALSLATLAYGYSNKGDSAKPFWNENLTLTTKYASKISIAACNFHIGQQYRYISNPQLAHPYYEKSVTLCKELEDYVHYYDGLKGLVAYFQYKNAYSKAIAYHLKAMDVAKMLDNQIAVNFTKRSLAQPYMFIKDYKKAEQLLLEAIAFFETSFTGKLKIRLVAIMYEQLGLAYHKQLKGDEAIVAYQKAYDGLAKLKAHEEERVAWQQLSLYLDLGQIENATAIHSRLKHAKGRYKKEEKAYLEEGRLFFHQKNYIKATKSIGQYIQKTKRGNFNKEKSKAYQLLYQIAKLQGKPTQALEYLETYKTIEDSLQKANEVENIQLVQSRHEITQKEADLLRMQQEKQLQALTLQRKEDELSIGRLYISILVLCILFIGAVGFWRMRQAKFKKEKEAIRHAAERIELEKQKASAHQKIELSRLKDELFANMSHELRTPLTLMLVPIKTFLKQANQEHRKVFKSILANGDQLLQLVDEILELSRLESGQTQLQKSPIDLSEFTLQLEASFSPLFHIKDIELNTSISVPNMGVMADANRLKMVLNNLLKNASHHCPSGGKVSLEITKAMVKDRPHLSIAVSNTGKAISEEHKKRIFDRFFRQEEQAYPGSGIGLALSRQIVELHGGTIAVENTQRGEVEFKILLPEKAFITGNANTTKGTLPQPDQSEELVVIDLHKDSDQKLPTVLVVEDNLEMQNLLKGLLEEEFTVYLASDGEQGVEMAVQMQPELIISDVMMPNKDGFELLKAIKSNIHSSHIPVMLLTARADNKSRIKGFDQDADEYISKPFDPETLLVRARNLLRQRKQLQQLFIQTPMLRAQATQCSTLDQDFITRAQEIVEQRYNDGDFTVEQFCKELALNRNSVHSKLKALTGQSASQFILTFRLTKAAEQLVSTRDTIYQIAMETGFNNRQIFNKWFLQQFGMTPGEYRKKNTN